MSRIDVEARAAGTIKALKRAERELGNPDPILEAMGDVLAASVRRRFYTQTGPTGRRWRKSKAARREKRRTLLKTGLTRESFEAAVSGGVLRVGTELPHVERLQFGGRTKRDRKPKNPRRAARRVNVSNLRSAATPGLNPAAVARDLAKWRGKRTTRRKRPTGVYIRPWPILGFSTRDRRKARAIVTERMKAALR